MIENVLAARYASKEMTELFDRRKRIILERDLWISVLQLQIKNGLRVSNEVLTDYEEVKEKIDFESIDKREMLLKHDVKARIEEFNFLAGHEVIHIGLTSRDVTENIELFLIKEALTLVRNKTLILLDQLRIKIEEFKDLKFVARTHNVPAQLSTLGKRFSVVAEELINSLTKLDFEISNLKFRGLKGAIGTSSDLANLFSIKQINAIETELARSFGFERILNSTGQIYPRSYDFSFVSCLVQLANPVDSFAKTLRLMAGQQLMFEGFQSKQIGSSAMPHKRNARTSERINGLNVVLRGLCNMMMSTAGDQWNEGDVSCSVVRRVVIPDSFFTIDGILNSAINVLQNLVVDKTKLEEEINQQLPNLISSKILMECVKNGVGREVAHKKIKELSLTFSTDRQSFFDAVTKDEVLKISKDLINNIQNSFGELTGVAVQQCYDTISVISKLIGNVSYDLSKYDIR